MYLAGALALSLSACGGAPASGDSSGNPNKDATSESDAAQQGTEHESAETAQGVPHYDRVSNREDYIGLQDLDIDAYVTLPDYQKMAVQVNRPQPSVQEIEQYIDSVLLRANREVREGDVVDIDYVGKKDGVAFQGGTASGYRLAIGSGSFIEGFEEGLIGVMPGDIVDLNLTFPEGYQRNPDLAGAEVVFTVTVNGVLTELNYADMTQEEFESLNMQQYKSKEELWEAGKAALDAEAERAFQTSVGDAIAEKLTEGSAIASVPDWLVEEEMQNYNIYMESVCNSRGVDLETFVTSYYQMAMEEYTEQLRELSEDIVRQYLVLEAVARAEGIEITRQQLEEMADKEAAELNSALPAGQEPRYASGQALIEEAGYSTYRKYAMRDKVIERLKGFVTVEETGTTSLHRDGLQE